MPTQSKRVIAAQVGSKLWPALALSLPFTLLIIPTAHADQQVGTCADELRDPDGRCPPPPGCSRAVEERACAAGFWNREAECCSKSKAQLTAERAAEAQRQKERAAERARAEQERARREEERRRQEEEARLEEERRRKEAFSRATELIDRDPVAYDDVSASNLSDEYREMARSKRHESMLFLKDLLKGDDAQGERRAEMILRLADLYYEEGRDLRLTGMERYDAALRACEDDERCDAAVLDSGDFTTEADDWQDKSVALYRVILGEYPDFSRTDEARYYLAMGLMETGESEDAVGEFTRLVRGDPNSRYAADAYVAIGEHYFDEGNAYKALVAYKKASAYQGFDKLDFALYKLAWCYYNVGEIDRALETMKTVASPPVQASTGSRIVRQPIQLQEEALLDLTRFFSDQGMYEESFDYFTEMKRWDLAATTLELSTTRLLERGDFDGAIAACRRLIAMNPESKDNPAYQSQVIEAYREQNKKMEALAEIQRLIDSYGEGSEWARANRSDRAALEQALALIEWNLRRVAIDYHNDAKKLGTGDAARQSYALAYKAYTVYLQEFPTSKYGYDIRYAFGELLYKVKKYDEAYDQYMKVVELDPDGRHSEFCAESAIFAADEMVKREQKEAGAAVQQRDPLASVPLSEWETKLIAALDQYAELVPDSNKTRNIVYKAAYLLFNKNHFEEAATRFRLAIVQDPSSLEAEQAARLVLDSFVSREDWSAVADHAADYLAIKGLLRGAAREEVEALRDRALEQ